MAPRKKLGEILVEQAATTLDAVDQVLTIQAIREEKLGRLLVEAKAITEEQLARALSAQSRVPLAKMKSEVAPAIAAMIPADLAEKHQAVAFGSRVVDGAETVYIAIADPYNTQGMDEIRARVGKPIKFALAPCDEIARALTRAAQLRPPEPKPVPAAPAPSGAGPLDDLFGPPQPPPKPASDLDALLGLAPPPPAPKPSASSDLDDLFGAAASPAPVSAPAPVASPAAAPIPVLTARPATPAPPAAPPAAAAATAGPVRVTRFPEKSPTAPRAVVKEPENEPISWADGFMAAAGGNVEAQASPAAPFDPSPAAALSSAAGAVPAVDLNPGGIDLPPEQPFELESGADAAAALGAPNLATATAIDSPLDLGEAEILPGVELTSEEVAAASAPPPEPPPGPVFEPLVAVPAMVTPPPPPEPEIPSIVISPELLAPEPPAEEAPALELTPDQALPEASGLEPEMPTLDLASEAVAEPVPPAQPIEAAVGPSSESTSDAILGDSWNELAAEVANVTGETAALWAEGQAAAGAPAAPPEAAPPAQEAAPEPLAPDAPSAPPAPGGVDLGLDFFDSLPAPEIPLDAAPELEPEPAAAPPAEALAPAAEVSPEPPVDFDLGGLEAEASTAPATEEAFDLGASLNTELGEAAPTSTPAPTDPAPAAFGSALPSVTGPASIDEAEPAFELGAELEAEVASPDAPVDAQAGLQGDAAAPTLDLGAELAAEVAAPEPPPVAPAAEEPGFDFGAELQAEIAAPEPAAPPAVEASAFDLGAELQAEHAASEPSPAEEASFDLGAELQAEAAPEPTPEAAHAEAASFDLGSEIPAEVAAPEPTPAETSGEVPAFELGEDLESEPSPEEMPTREMSALTLEQVQRDAELGDMLDAAMDAATLPQPVAETPTVAQDIAKIAQEVAAERVQAPESPAEGLDFSNLFDEEPAGAEKAPAVASPPGPDAAAPVEVDADDIIEIDPSFDSAPSPVPVAASAGRSAVPRQATPLGLVSEAIAAAASSPVPRQSTPRPAPRQPTPKPAPRQPTPRYAESIPAPAAPPATDHIGGDARESPAPAAPAAAPVAPVADGPMIEALKRLADGRPLEPGMPSLPPEKLGQTVVKVLLARGAIGPQDLIGLLAIPADKLSAALVKILLERGLITANDVVAMLTLPPDRVTATALKVLVERGAATAADVETALG